MWWFKKVTLAIVMRAAKPSEAELKRANAACTHAFVAITQGVNVLIARTVSIDPRHVQATLQHEMMLGVLDTFAYV